MERRYKCEIHGVKIGITGGVYSGSNGTILDADFKNHQVLMLDLEEDEVKQAGAAESRREIPSQPVSDL